MSTEHDLKIKEFHQKHEEANFNSSLNRARSIAVGTCFNGVTEVMMRGNDGKVLWCPMQPQEIVELIHQLAANIGCHIAVKPRQDFASWRNWKNDYDTTTQLTSSPTTKIELKDEQNEQVMATQENIRRKRVKRTTTST